MIPADMEIEFEAQGKWAFVHYAADNGERSDTPPRSFEASPLQKTYSEEETHRDQMRYVARVYDLRGWLRCMVDEGRPLPESDMIEELEEILETRSPASRELVCELLTDEDVPEVIADSIAENNRGPALAHANIDIHDFHRYFGRVQHLSEQ